MYSVIIPTRGRAQQVALCIDQLIRTTLSWSIEIIVVADEDDQQTLSLLPSSINPVIVADDTPIAKWNIGLQHASGDYVVVGADDVWWYDRWLDEVINFGGDFIGLNTLEYNERHFTHFVMSRRYVIEHNGGVVFYPGYKHLYADNEVNERAKRVGLHRFCSRAVVEHRHPAHGKAQIDMIYKRSERYGAEDKLLFESRQKVGFPDDFVGVWQ